MKLFIDYRIRLYCGAIEEQEKKNSLNFQIQISLQITLEHSYKF